ncbi:phage tail tape measure protein [Enterococcus diestrammenae]|uniref:Phage tail tape measure protein domain-containing protein n=1 Tax=Enterococcus diestrammenae TaxID=1155073 RepID=A0ABV0EYV7_9ENTE|nr:phage tail tape measure protein [Enterococcus diestrammenae]KAF1294807.1 phage tail tape measure protein [Enterococcus diestrammenae]
MTQKESDVVLNFKTNGEVSYAKTIKEINKDMNLAATEYKNQVSAMDKDATQTEKLTATKQKLEKQVELAGQRTQMLREEYQKSVKETGQYSAESEKLYKKLLDSQTGENKLKDALEATNEALEEQGKMSTETAEKLKKIDEAGEKISGVGEKMSVGVTAPILAAGAAGIKAANDISTAQTEIQAAFGLTESEAENLNQAMEEVFASGMVDSIDESKEAVIQLVNQMPKLKNESSDSIKDIILQAKSLEKTFGSDVEETLKGANALMTNYGMSGQEAMDMITVASQNGLDKSHELGDNLAEYAIQFKQNGYSAQEMFEVLDSGLKGGAYNLDKVNDLAKEFGVRFSDGTIEAAVEELGGEWQDLYTEMKNGGASNEEVFSALAEKISKVGDDTQKATLVSTIFGSLGEDNATKVIEAMAGLSEETEGVKGSYDNVAGAGKNMSDQIQETVSYQSAMNEVMLAGAEVGNIFAPYIQKAADAIKAFAQWFKGLDQNSKNWIVTIGLIVAAVGPFLIILGKLVGSVSKVANGIKTLKSVFTAMKLAFAANPFVLVIAGITLLIAGFVLAYNKCKWFRDGVNKFFQGIKDVGSSVFNFLKNHVSGVFGGIMANFNNFASAGKRIFNGFLDFITGVFTGNWKKAWNGVVDIFGGIFDGIASLVKAPINNAIGLINDFLGNLGSIEIPEWVPKIGGKTFSIGKIPYLAKGGHLINGQAIVGEAGPELLNVGNGKTTVTPLSDPDKKNPKGPQGNISVEQHNHFGNVDANNPSELDRLNRKMELASKQAIYDMGGVPV